MVDKRSVGKHADIKMKQLVFFIVITAIASCGQNEPLTKYEPKSPQEHALKSVLLDFQDGVNTLDSKKVENNKWYIQGWKY